MVQTHPVKSLAGCAVTVLDGKRLFASKLVFHLATVTFALPLDIKIVVLLVDPVRRTVLPLILVAMRRLAGLVLVRLLPAAVGILLTHLAFCARHLLIVAG